MLRRKGGVEGERKIKKEKNRIVIAEEKSWGRKKEG